MQVIQLAPAWPDWRIVDDQLIDDAGTRYSKWEIRALPYVFGLNKELHRIIERLRPPQHREPEQLTLPFPAFYLHQREFLRRRRDHP